MLTDHDGHFEFDGVTLPGIPPWAMKPGYFSQDRFNRFRPLDADNTSSSPTAKLIVKLVPEAIVSGTVTGQDGNPLEGIPVQLKTLATQDGLSRWRPRHADADQRRGTIPLRRTRGREICSHYRLPHRGAGRLPGRASPIFPLDILLREAARLRPKRPWY